MTSYDSKRFGDNFLDDIIDWISTYIECDDVYSEEKLSEWAEKNGYVKEAKE